MTFDGCPENKSIFRISKLNRITSIADFVASRYGKSQLLGGLVTVIAVVGAVAASLLGSAAMWWPSPCAPSPRSNSPRKSCSTVPG